MRFLMATLLSVVSLGAQAETASRDPFLAHDALFVLSDRHGRGITIGQHVDVREKLLAAPMSGTELADRFDQLCLKTNLDQAMLASVAGSNGTGLTSRETELTPHKGDMSFQFNDYVSPSLRVSIWDGDDVGLKGRPTLIRDRGIDVLSQYDQSDAVGRQCNLDTKLSNFYSIQALVDRLTAHVGAPPVKIVIKKSFADGHWEIPGKSGFLRVSFTAVDLKKPAALVHLTVQELQEKARK